jgi:hypothetical protein
MVHREVTQQGWLSRMGGAFKAMIAGVVMLALALALQFWNEGRTLKRDNTLAEGRAQVVAVDAAALDPGREGKLVHVSGGATAAAPVDDPAFGVSLPALALRRVVQMYQWKETRDSKEERTTGGGKRTVTEYRYRTEWDDDAIDSGDFREGGHDNPGPLPYANETWRASPIRLGAFTLSDEAAGEIDGWERVADDRVQLPPNLAASFRLDDGWYVTSAEPASPEVGDVRVRFDYIPEGVVSVVARQQGGMLVPHATSRGGELLLVESGPMDAKAMFAAEGSRNSMAAWALRGAGFVLAWIAFGILLKPLVVMADVLPIAGRIAGFGVGLASFVLALVVSVLAIGSGWLFYRPWALVILAGLFAVALVWRLRGTREARPPPPPVPVPPPPPPAA